MGKFEEILEQNYWAQRLQKMKQEEESKRKQAAAKSKATREYKATKSKYILGFEESLAKRYGKAATFDDRTANGLTKFVMAYLDYLGHYSARINIGGTAIGARGCGGREMLRWAESGSTKGVADVIACIDGLFVQFEVKAGNDRPREDQLAEQERTIAAGGAYVFVHDAAEFVLLYSCIKQGLHPYEIVSKRNFAKSDIRPNESVGLMYDDTHGGSVSIIPRTDGNEMKTIGDGLKKIYYLKPIKSKEVCTRNS